MTKNVMVDYSDIKKILLDAQYEIIYVDDKHAIDMLNHWLSEWLNAKAQCPCCGDSNDG